MYRFSGLFGQLVTVFPSQGIVIVRTGQDPGLVFSGGANWEHEPLRARARRDHRPAGSAARPGAAERGRRPAERRLRLRTSVREPDQYSQGANQDPLPPAGPARARAVQLGPASARASRRGYVTVRLFCPVRWPARMRAGCRGRVTLSGARKKLRFHVSPGKSKRKRFRLTGRRLRALRRARSQRLNLAARTFDAYRGTITRERVTVLRPRRAR